MRRPTNLERLLRIRELQEEQKRCQLNAASAKLEALHKSREVADEMKIRGQALVRASVSSGEMTDRQAGIIEAELAGRRSRGLTARILSAQEDAIELRQKFMDTRLERRQVETLVDIQDLREDMESDRSSQKSIDDWFGARTHRKGVCDENHG